MKFIYDEHAGRNNGNNNNIKAEEQLKCLLTEKPKVEKRRSEPPRYANVNVFDQTATNFSVV
jgi:hypothetical protein